MKHRNTIQRSMVYEAVNRLKSHATASEIYDVIASEHPSVSQGTVYRNLNLFVQEGRIQKISGEGWSYYDGNPKPHDHLHCRCCGRIFDYRAPYDAAMDRAAEEFTGGKIEFHSTTYEGICKDCLMKEDPEGSKEKN